MEYRKATIEDLEKIWNKDILGNPGDKNYLRWKHQYIENNLFVYFVYLSCIICMSQSYWFS